MRYQCASEGGKVHSGGSQWWQEVSDQWGGGGEALFTMFPSCCSFSLSSTNRV